MLKRLLILPLFIVGMSFPTVRAAESYCGNSLRIDRFNCTLVNTGVEKFCQKNLVDSTYVAACTGNPSNCFTTSKLSGSSDSCVLAEGGQKCEITSSFKTCWVNPGDPPPPPPPPPGTTCGSSCNNSSQCNGLTCAPAGVCWGAVCDTGDPVATHRVKVKVFNCSGNGASGVKVSAWGNSCTTGSNGECVVQKGKACNDEQIGTPVLAGKDADSSQPYYYSRVDSPSFQRGDCGSINCNYNNSATMSSPYRQAYHIDMNGETVDTFKWKFCATSDSGANYGFNFKQLGCNADNQHPNISISGPTNLSLHVPYTWSLTASDNDDGVDSFGAYIGLGTNPSSWTTLYFTNPPTALIGVTNVSTNSWVCPAAGTYTIAANATDVSGQKCSGNPVSSDVVRCASGKDRLTVTCAGSSTCAGPAITCGGVCTTTNQMKTTCTWVAPNGVADTAFAVGIRYCSSSTTCDNWFYKSSDAAADAALFSKTVTGSAVAWKFEATGPDSLKQYRVRVKTSSACLVSDSAFGTTSSAGPACKGTKNPTCSIYGLAGDMFVGESRNYTATSSDPDGGNMVFTGLYSSPSAVANWTLLGQSTANTAAGTFRCATPGTFYIACNARDDDNTFCSGSPFAHQYAVCGSQASRTVVCKPNTSGITLKNEIVQTSQSKGSSPYKGSDIITFRVTVTNTGTSTLSNVSVLENIPSYTSFAPTQSAILNSGKAGTWTLSNGKYNFNIGTLAAGASYNVYYAVVVNNYTAPGTYASSNTACANAGGIASGPCGTVNFDLLDIVENKKLIVTQELVSTASVSKGTSPFVYGDVLVFRITAKNEGNQRIDDVELQDTVPAYSRYLEDETNSLNGSLKGVWDCTKDSAGGVCTIPVGSLNPGSSYFVYFVVTITNYIDNEADIKSKNDVCGKALGLGPICSSYSFDLKDLTVNPGTKITGLLLNYTSGACEESATNPKLKESDVKNGEAIFKLRNGTNPAVTKGYDFSTNKFYFEEILDPTNNVVLCADKLSPALSLGAGSFKLSCVKINGVSNNLVQNGKCTADLSPHLNFEAANTVTLGFKYVPVSADPWIQTESGDVYAGSTASGESVLNIIQKVGSYMVTKIGSVFGNKTVLVEDIDGATRYSQKGAKVQKFIKTNESTWPEGFEFTSPAAAGLNASNCNLDNKVYKSNNATFASWLNNCSSYSIANDGLAVIYAGGNTIFDNSSGLYTNGSGRLIVIVNGSAVITDNFGKDSNKAGFGLIVKNGVEFANSGVSGLDTLDFKGFIATKGSNKDVKFLRSLEAANEERPAVNVIFDPSYIAKLSQNKLKNADQALGLTKFDLIWEVYD